MHQTEALCLGHRIKKQTPLNAGFVLNTDLAWT